MLTRIGLPLLAAGLLIFALFHTLGSAKPEPKRQPPVPPPRAPFPGQNVAGAGMVEAQTENIAIGSPLPGVVVEVPAKVADRVQPGMPLFRLDDRQLRAELGLRQAAVAAAQAELARLEAMPRKEQLDMAAAQVAEAKSRLEDMREQRERGRTLHAQKAIADQDYERRERAWEMAQSQLDRARAEHAMQQAGAWEYDKLVARAAVDQAKAQARMVETELERLVVRAPVEAEVLQVNVRPGEFVGAPAAQPLVVIGNVHRLHVRVDISEYDIHRFDRSAPASAMPKGQTERVLPLRFVRIEPFVVPKKSLTGDNTERVDTRVLQVIYALEPGADAIYVGQQLDVFIEASRGTAQARATPTRS